MIGAMTYLVAQDEERGDGAGGLGRDVVAA
jgi:hypothetical protein